MLRYGIVSHNHDASISIIEDQRILFASQSERFSRTKNDPNLSKRMIEYCLKHFGIPSEIHYFEDPDKRLDLNLPWSFKSKKIELEKELKALFHQKISICFHNHHLSHAATGLYTSGFKNALILVLDAIGENRSLTLYIYQHSQFRILHKTYYPHSMGLFYSAMTARIGLTPNRDEYILMGLAAKGLPIYKERLLTEFFKDIGIHLKLKINCHKDILGWGEDIKALDYPNLAASVQAIYEDYLIDVLSWAKEKTHLSNLVLGGGGALNCVANAIMSEKNLFDKIWINPNPGDSGSALGAVALEAGALEYQDSFLGVDFKEDINLKKCIHILSSKKALSLTSGKAEFGPRALGARSILYDASLEDAKIFLNALKKRESFRPFAPAILEEYAQEYFLLNEACDYRFMQYAVPIKKTLPGYTHSNQRARIQVVPQDGSALRQILEAWYKKSEIPLLLNTSLNTKNKPIVNSMGDLTEVIGDSIGFSF